MYTNEICAIFIAGIHINNLVLTISYCMMDTCTYGRFLYRPRNCLTAVLNLSSSWQRFCKHRPRCDKNLFWSKLDPDFQFSPSSNSHKTLGTNILSPPPQLHLQTWRLRPTNPRKRKSKGSCRSFLRDTTTVLWDILYWQRVSQGKCSLHIIRV